MRQPRGAQLDGAPVASPWGFDPAEIRIPIQRWYSEQARNTPIAMGRYLAATIPHVRPHFLPDEGYFSVLAHHAETILSKLINARV